MKDATQAEIDDCEWEKFMFVSLEALIGFNLKSRDVRDGQYLLPYDIKYATSLINASCVI